jgi:hypothetical protein
MTQLGDAIEALRAAVAAGGTGDRAAVADAVDAGPFEEPEIVVVPGEGTIDHVIVRPVERVTVEELEAVLGPASPLPLEPSGGAPSVLFGDTLPGEGESGATVLAEVDDDGRIDRLIVRADAF